MKSSSIQDVAQLAHVSISTVSRSFTRPDLVSKATRDKVMKAADELNFSISRSAAALKTGRALRIAVLVSGRLNLWFSSSIIEGLNEVFHDEGYDISIYQMSSTEERSEFFNMLPVRRNVDAVIVISFDIASNEIEQLRSIDVPIIGINSSLPEERGFNAAVRIDDKQGSELAARHLMMLGHRNIVYIRSDREVTLHFSVQGRYESFMACCQANGVEPRVLVTDDWQEQDQQGRDASCSASTTCRRPSPARRMASRCRCCSSWNATVSPCRTTSPSSVTTTASTRATSACTTIRQTPVEMAREAARMTLALNREAAARRTVQDVPRAADRPFDHRSSA